MSQTYLASNWGSVSQAVKFPPKWFDFFKAMRYPKNFRSSRLITPARFTPSTPQKDLHGKIFALLDRFPQFWDFALCKEVQAQQRVFLYRVRAIKKNTGETHRFEFHGPDQGIVEWMLSKKIGLDQRAWSVASSDEVDLNLFPRCERPHVLYLPLLIAFAAICVAVARMLFSLALFDLPLAGVIYYPHPFCRCRMS